MDAWMDGYGKRCTEKAGETERDDDDVDDGRGQSEYGVAFRDARREMSEREARRHTVYAMCFFMDFGLFITYKMPALGALLECREVVAASPGARVGSLHYNV